MVVALLDDCMGFRAYVRGHQNEPSRDREGAVFCGLNRPASVWARLGKRLFTHAIRTTDRDDPAVGGRANLDQAVPGVVDLLQRPVVDQVAGLVVQHAERWH